MLCFCRRGSREQAAPKPPRKVAAIPPAASPRTSPYPVIERGRDKGKGRDDTASLVPSEGNQAPKKFAQDVPDLEPLKLQETGSTAQWVGTQKSSKLAPEFPDSSSSEQASSEEDARIGPDASGLKADDLATGERTESSKLLDGLLGSFDPQAGFPGVHGGNPLVHDAAYEWVTSTSDYTTFRQNDSTRMLWVIGAPGVGKSVVLAAIVQRLAEQANDGSGQEKIAYFFCHSGKPKPENAASVIESLVWQVLKQQPHLAKHLDMARKTTGRARFDRPTDFCAISGVFYTMLQDEHFLATCFVLDAIGGYYVDGHEAKIEPGLEDILGLISKATRQSPKVKWLLSVDPNSDKAIIDFAKGDTDDPHRPLCLTVDSSSDAMGKAARAHVTSKVLELTQGTPDDADSRARVEEQLLERSQGNFLWVDLACQLVRSRDYPSVVLQILEKLPSTGVVGLYSHANTAIGALPLDDSKYCHQVLFAMAAAYRPLHISELKVIAGLPLAVDLTILIANKCPIFLKVCDGRVFFVHRSARDFLREKMEPAFAIHADITRRCVEFLSESLSKATATASEEASQPCQYAKLYWLRHLSKVLSSKSDDKIMSSVENFLSEHLLQWLEALTPPPSLSQALVEMDVLVNILRVRANFFSHWMTRNVSCSVRRVNTV